MKTQVGYGSDRRERGKKGMYAGRRGGKVLRDGGFNHCPVVDFATVTDEQFAQIFPNAYVPSWKKDSDGKVS